MSDKARRESRRYWKPGAWLAVAMMLPVVGSADQRSVEDIVKGRQSNLRDLGSAYKELGEQLKKKKPLAFMLQQYVGQIDELARQEEHWFPAGSGPESGIETKAKADIWTKPAEFKSAMQKFRKESEALVALSTDDIDALKAQHRKLGETCKGCHDPFREKDD